VLVVVTSCDPRKSLAEMEANPILHHQKLHRPRIQQAAVVEGHGAVVHPEDVHPTGVLLAGVCHHPNKWLLPMLHVVVAAAQQTEVAVVMDVEENNRYPRG